MTTFGQFNARVTRAREKRDPELARRTEALRRLKRTLVDADATAVPANLDALRRYLGVKEVRAQPLAIKGRIIADGPDVAIELNESMSAFDRQFTFAHELAHLILERTRFERQWHSDEPRTVREFEGIERLCDALAEQILLPVEWLEVRLQSRPTLTEASAVASESATDLTFVVRRAIDLRIWKALLIRWESNEGAFVPSEAIPATSRLFVQSVRPIGNQPSILAWSAERDGEVQEGELEIDINGECGIFHASCISVDQGGVLSLLTLAR